jgi:hypothetical protein
VSWKVQSWRRWGGAKSREEKLRGSGICVEGLATIGVWGLERGMSSMIWSSSQRSLIFSASHKVDDRDLNTEFYWDKWRNCYCWIS